MQRFLCIHCRGAPSSRIRPEKVIFSFSRPLLFSEPIFRARFFHNSSFTCQNTAITSRSSFRWHLPRYLLVLSAAASVPIVAQELKDDAEEDEDLTLEQRLLNTSEEERRARTYGVSKDQSIFYRFFKHLRIAFTRYIYEPIATGMRFIQLVAIFVPVFATIPIIFIGSRDPNRDNERTGTLWWYAFLVKQMEKAGATFIKVQLFVSCALIVAWTMGRLAN
jgi:hypothetical protein